MNGQTNESKKRYKPINKQILDEIEIQRKQKVHKRSDSNFVAIRKRVSF